MVFPELALARVIAVCKSPLHGFSKQLVPSIRLLKGLGVAGDAHCGETVKHRSRVAQDPLRLNLRQVHLIHGELFEQLSAQGFRVGPGMLGENVTTYGVDLLSLPEGAELSLGAQARVRITGLRNPCVQIDRFQAGLMRAVLEKRDRGEVVRKAGVMAIVIAGGAVTAGDEIRITLPEGRHRSLRPV